MPQVVVGAALSTGLGYAFGTVTAATLASTFAQNLILGAISYALQDKPKMAEQGLNIGNVREPVSPRKVIYGETRVGGTYLFVDTSEVVWAVLATNPSDLPSDHPHYDDGGEGGAADFNITDDPITYSSGITINADTYYLATDADGNQCYTGSTTKTYGRIGYKKTKRHNEFFQFVTAVAGHEVEEISDIYFEDEHIATFNQTTNVAETLESGVTRFNSDDGRQKPLFAYREGTSTQSAIQQMRDNIPFDHTTYKTTGVVYDGTTSGGWTKNNNNADCGRNLKYIDGGTQPKDFTDYESVGQAWGADHQCKDTAIVYGRLAYNPNVYINGLPKVTYRVKGKKLYDPRTSTTTYGNNAALCILDYLMDDKYGLGVSTSEINMQSFEDAADVCDEDVTLAEGGTEKRYTINGMIDTSLTPRDVLENMLTACAGKLIYVNGQFKLLAAKYRTSSASITEDDIISSISVSTKNSNRTNYNGVKGQFRDPNSEPPFIATEYPVVTSSAFETIDGKQSYTNLDLPFTTSSATAQRLAKLLLNRSRQEVTISFKAKLSAINVTAGDTISVTNNRLNFTNKTFEVTSSELGFDGTSMYVAITAVEVSSATFDWDAEESAIINNGKVDYREFNIQPPTNLSSSAIAIVQNDGTAVGGITLSWDASPSQFVVGYEVQIKLSTDSSYDAVTTSETSYISNGRFITGATYNIRIRAVTNTGGYSDYLVGTVDMPDDSTAPSAPTGLTATADNEGILLDWDANTENDLKGYDIYENTVNSSGTATKIATMYADRFTRTGLGAGATRYYWVKAVDYSGNESDFSTGASATSTAITAEAQQPRSAWGYLYYSVSTTSRPSKPSASSYNFDTNSFGSISSNWSTTFTVPDVQGTYWAVRYNVVEDTYEGSATVTITTAFKWQNMEGLVTFTNLATETASFITGYEVNANVTSIDGGVITTGVIDADYIDVSGVLDVGTGGLISGYAPYPSGWTTPPYAPSYLNGSRFGVDSSGWTYIDTLSVYGHAYTGTLTCSDSVGSPVMLGEQNSTSSNSHGIKATTPSSTSGYAFYTDQDAYIGGTTYPFTAGHRGVITKGYSLEQGDIVCDAEKIHSFGISGNLFRVAKSITQNQSAIGVFNMSREYDDEQFADIDETAYTALKASDDLVSFNAVGEGSINVCGENGDIAVGDLIVTSNTAGKGMKQDDDIVRSYTVAKAREAVTFASADEVHQIACIYLCG
jgi:hypothetical protein